MGSPTQAALLLRSGSYTWKVPGKSIAVHLDLDVIDKTLPEFMRAFGAVPKRGAEAGGLLLGCVEQHPEATIVRVTEAEFVPCLYARGPSYLLSTDDNAAFEQALQRRRAGSSPECYAVGYFRSHTREGLTLSSEDINLLERLFPDQTSIALLVRPFASKPIQAGFFFRENGIFPEETPLPFLFSRAELQREVEQSAPPPALPASQPVSPAPEPSTVAAADSIAKLPTARRPFQGSPRRVIPLPDESSQTVQETSQEEAPAELSDAVTAKPTRKLGWIWIPLLFLFLAIGAGIGFIAPAYTNVNALVGLPGEFSLGLKVSQTGDALTVSWNPNSPAIRNAQSGTLEIEDGGYSKPVEMDSGHLANGSLIYRNTSQSIRFRLTVAQSARVAVTETADWP